MVDWAPTGTGGSKGGGPGRQSMHLDANFMHRGGILRDPAPFLLPRQRPGGDTAPGHMAPGHTAPRARGPARPRRRARTRAREQDDPAAARTRGGPSFTAPGPGAPDMWLEWWHKSRPPAGSAPAETWPRGRHCLEETQLPPARPEGRTHAGAHGAATAARTSANKREQAQPGSRRDRPRPAPKCFWRNAIGQMWLAPRIRDMWLGSRIWKCYGPPT